MKHKSRWHTFSRALTKREIARGAAVVEQMRDERRKLLDMVCQDNEHYGSRKDRKQLRGMFLRRYARDARINFNPTRRNLARAIANYAEWLMEECPNLPCGADDAWYERRDAHKPHLERYIAAYRFLCYSQRVRA